jgi:membrane dipeptidase
MKPTTAAGLLLCTLLPLSGLAETVTLSGSVKHKAALTPIDSVTIEIVNEANPSERYTVSTDALGLWSYTFNLAAVDEAAEVPHGFSVEQNYPNPFNPSTHITFSIPGPGEVTLAVHTVIGQCLDQRTVMLDGGDHTVAWTAKGAAGVLFYSIAYRETRITRKMIQLDGHGDGGLGNVVTTGRRATTASIAKASAQAFSVTASKLLYMPDTVHTVLEGDAAIDFTLETVHEHAFLFDLHNDVLEKAVLGYQLGPRHTTEQSDLPRFRDGGMDAQMFALWTDWTDSAEHPYYAYTLAMVDTFLSQIRQNPTQLAQARNFDEVMQVHAEGKLAGVLGVEGGHAIENDIAKLRTFYDLGARYLTITWNNSLSWAVSAQDPRSSAVGLSEFGRQVIRTMDSLGMIVDVSHTGVKTIWDILGTTKNPIIASHSGVRALNNHYRNLNDFQIDSIAAHGGVIGVVFYPTFLSARRTATIDTVIKHIDYIRNLVGVDYIAIGSDYDGIETVPVGLEDVSKMPNLTAALLKKGYSIADVHKILGGNYLRVFKQVCR